MTTATRVMVVEDERIVAHNLKQRLSKLDYDVVAVVACGAAALQGIERYHPEVVLMDINIEGDIDGIETAARIPTESGASVIYLTAYSEQATLERAAATRPHGYLLKPFSEREMHATIQMVLARRQFEDETRLIRRQLAQMELEAIEARAAQQLGEMQAVLAERKRAEVQMNNLQAELAHVSRWNAMGMMAATLAHELTQPLTAVRNYISTARRTIDGLDTPQAGRAKELMAKAVDQTTRAGAIIKNLREFIEKRETNRRYENLNRVVEEAIALGIVGGGNIDLKVRVELAPIPPFVFANKVEIQQVLINLFRNSIEAMRGSERRELTVMIEPDGSEFVCVAVSDTGPGIAPDLMSRLFEPFTTTKQDGMGIGLNICQSIIEAHGGRIWLTSNLKEGVTFRFRLPITETPGNGSVATMDQCPRTRQRWRRQSSQTATQGF